ncbi:Uncharacterised protein [Klebsiella variicola]|nr:Uncharacterised protein [Klebsiella variicola]
MSFLVEAHFEMLHCGRALSRQQGAGLILGTDIVCSSGVTGLKERPVRVKFKGKLKPRAIREAAGPNGVHQLELFPGTCR